MKKALDDRVQCARQGFAAGVMVAASVWSLLLPAIEQSMSLGRFSFLPAFLGFWAGILSLLLLDQMVRCLCVKSGEAMISQSQPQRTRMMVLAVTLHNIPEGIAVGVDVYKRQAKQEALEETFQEAAEKIAALDGSVYLDFIVKTLEPYREEGGEISLNARDYANLKDSLEKALAGSKLTVGAEQANIAGGFILKQGKLYLNASLEKILETEKKQMTGEVAGILFG